MKELSFEWDQWNIQKNEHKHGVGIREAESAFHDPKRRLFFDGKHSTKSEKRYIIFGQSTENRILMIGFTIRSDKIRVITARPASRKERAFYEKKS